MMKNTIYWIIAFSLAPVSALAMDVPCSPPQQPQLPVALTSAAEVQTYETETLTYLDAAASYNQCLVAYAEDNLSGLTQADKDELRNLYDNQEAQAKSIADTWNTLYAQYINQE